MPVYELLFPSHYVSLEIREQRMVFCRACPQLRPVSKTCKKCQCVVKQKTKLKNEQCPLSKWGKVEK